MSDPPHRSQAKPITRRIVGVAIGVAALIVPSTLTAAVPCWEPPVSAPITDPYREPACRWCPGNRGIEYRPMPGTRVRSVASGRVTFASSVAGRRYVVVRHVNGWRTTYGDLATIAVDVGDAVVARSVVGTSGDRFHFGLRVDDGYRDPTLFLGRLVYRPRLIPIDGSPGAPAGPPRLSCRRVSVG